MSTKDEIIKEFSSCNQGLMDLIMILLPKFDTFHMSDEGALYLVDSIKRKGLAIWKESDDSFVLKIYGLEIERITSISSLIRVSVIPDPLTTHEQLALIHNEKRIESDVDKKLL